MKALSGGATKYYVYDALGNLAAEYTPAGTPLPPCSTCYWSWDHLGSTRMVTNGNGSVVARHDFLPFATELNRGGLWGGTDNLSPKFTGKERDAETGLDFFGAR